MASVEQFRLYTFVAGNYLSPLQAGIQSLHAAAELSVLPAEGRQSSIYRLWACEDKTVIVCNAANHAGVLKAFELIEPLANRLGLPCALFREDEVSLNGAATAMSVIVPANLYDVEFTPEREELEGSVSYYKHTQSDGSLTIYANTTPDYRFIEVLKSYPLYR